MIILTRKRGEGIVVRGDIVIKVHSIRENKVYLDISAPKNVSVIKQPLCCISGYSGRPRELYFDPDWLTWSNATIPKMARNILTTKSFGDLPIFADALEEAGCTNVDIINHFRLVGPHAKDCWVLKLFLGGQS